MRLIKLSVISLSVIALSGCVPLFIGGATETAVVVAQERSVGNAVDDAAIVLQIKNLYAKQDYKDLLANVEIKVVEGRVLLTGNVDKPDSQIEAVKLAWQIGGVKEVINEVQINDKSGFWNYAKDVWISTQVRTRLLFGKNIRNINYSVITVNQVVYLMGIAQSQEELNRATNVASATSYVQRVVSYVRLKDDPRRGYLPN
ncbi:MAG: BON domain-containing protein [Pseudomonadota bacterium]